MQYVSNAEALILLPAHSNLLYIWVHVSQVIALNKKLIPLSCGSRLK